MKDRVFADDNKRHLFEKLCLDQKNKIFNTNKDLFLFAVAIGFKYKQKLPLRHRGTEIPFTVFQKDKKNFYFIDLIALGDTEDVHILDWDSEKIVDEKIKIFEEYANAGLEVIDQKLFKESGDIFENLLQLIYKELENNNIQNFDLDDLIEKIKELK